MRRLFVTDILTRRRAQRTGTGGVSQVGEIKRGREKRGIEQKRVELKIQWQKEVVEKRERRRHGRKKGVISSDRNGREKREIMQRRHTDGKEKKRGKERKREEKRE